MSNVIKIENRGGKRAGAGRKPKTVAEKTREFLLRAERTKKLRTGKGVADYVMDIIASPKIGGSTRVQAAKLFYEVTAGTVRETVHTENKSGPTIYLPEELPEPERD